MESLLVIESSEQVKISNDVLMNAHNLKAIAFGEDQVLLR
jgi:hypothetical protein